MKPARDKPHIRLIGRRLWGCAVHGMLGGMGSTPLEAYRVWASIGAIE